MEGINEKCQKQQLEKEQKKAEKIKANIEKCGFQIQHEALKQQGFEDDKFILKSLKKSNGDLLKAAEFLKEKRIEKTEGEKDGQKREKKWKKYLKKDCTSSDEETQTADGEKADFCEKKVSKAKEGIRNRMIEKHPNFPEFNERMKKLGFESEKKNFKALKKSQGDEQKAQEVLTLKNIQDNLQLCDSVATNQYSRVYVDCNNCFYLEHAFLKRAIKGNFLPIEEKITILMKRFQNVYGSPIEMILFFDDSKLLSHPEKCNDFLDKNNFQMISARPEFNSADDALVALAKTENEERQEKALYVTSDRVLQARLVEAKAKHIIGSKKFFNILRDSFLGKRDYSAIVEV